MVSLEVVAILLSGISISASLIYYSTVLKNQNKTRESQLFMQIFQNMNTEKFWATWIELLSAEISTYDEFVEKFDSTVNRDHFAKRTQMWYNYHSIGDLLRRGVISIETVENIVGVGAIAIWHTWGEMIKEIGVHNGMPNIYNGFEYLYNELMDYYEKHPDQKRIDMEIFGNVAK
jgi:hypothetical protein